MSAAAVDARQRERLATELRHNLSDRPGLQVLELEPLGAGWETDLYRVGIRFDAPSGPAEQQLALRLYRGLASHDRAVKEFKLLQNLIRLRIPVAAVIQVIHQPDASFIVMEHLPEANLRERLADASDSQILGQLDRMAALLVQIHRTRWQQALPHTAPQSPDELLREMHRTAERYQLHEFEPHLTWLDHRRPQVTDRPVLLHNDFHPENLLVRDGALVAIDWSFAAVGDYRMDLAWTVLLVGTMLGERFRHPMLQSYQLHRGAPVQHFEYFEVLKLGSRMLTILTWLDKRVEIPVHRITRKALHGEYKIHVLNPYRRLVELTGLELPSIEAL